MKEMEIMLEVLERAPACASEPEAPIAERSWYKILLASMDQ